MYTSIHIYSWLLLNGISTFDYKFKNFILYRNGYNYWKKSYTYKSYYFLFFSIKPSILVW